jgi:hypothetical protein
VQYKFSEVVTAATGGSCNFDTCTDTGGDGGSGTGDPFVDEDCETFLDPAALEARDRGDQVTADTFVEAQHADRFALGMSDALAVEDLEENTDYSEVEHLKDTVQAEGMCEHSPLVLDLAGNGIAASAPEVRFDLKARGVPFLVAWPAGDDAFLALDRDGDGRIGDGGELFGNHSAPNGFATLAAFDNGDGVIDARDAVFAQLRVWRDRDRDGASAAGELETLRAAGVASISLAYTASDARDSFGNALAQQGSFTRVDGTTSQVIDVWLRMRR